MAKVITTELQHAGASAANITLDSSKNVTCENNLQVDGNVTVTGTLPADKLTGALPAISGASLTGISTPLSNRNKIINGAMTVSQRLGTSSLAYDSSGKQFVTDRWGLSRSGMTFDVTASQSTDAPAGFHNSLKIEADTTQTPGANEVGVINYDIEGRDLQDLEFGHSTAKDITVSFWCKVSANAVGDYSLQLMYTKESDNSGRSVWKKFTPTTSWARYTLTFPGTGSATSDHIKVSDSYTGMYLYMFLCAGSGKLADETNTWAAQGDYRAHTTQTNFLDSADNEFYITGVQFEAGSTATDFEHRSYDDELSRCQRYFQTFLQKIGLVMRIHSSTQALTHVPLHKNMRVTPTYAMAPSNANFDILDNGSVLANQGHAWWSFSAGGARQGGFELMGTRSSGTWSDLNTVIHANLKHEYGPSDAQYWASASAEL